MTNKQDLKPVTLMLPSHIAALIEETRKQLPGQWEEWLASPARQSLEQNSFGACRREFDGLFVDSQWTFDGVKDRAEFVAPLHDALKRTYLQRS